MLVDSHCHLDYLARKGEDIDAIIQRAEAVGVGKLLTVATTLAGETQLAELCATYPQVFRSVGVHPNHVGEEPDVTTEQLITLSKQPKVIALGETGIDYFRGSGDADLQKRVFAAHLVAAQETSLPLIIHTRSADDDTIHQMQKAYAEKPYTGVFHCYIGSEAILQAANEMDFYVSITGIATYGKSGDLREQIKNIPHDRIMVETDAPFLAPKPHRGKQCEPYMVQHTAALVAELLQMDMIRFSAQTTENFFRLFHRAHAAA